MICVFDCSCGYMSVMYRCACMSACICVCVCMCIYACVYASVCICIAYKVFSFPIL